MRYKIAVSLIVYSLDLWYCRSATCRHKLSSFSRRHAATKGDCNLQVPAQLRWLSVNWGDAVDELF